MPEWARRAAARFNRYVTERAKVYALEGRWRDAPFWQRRGRARGGSARGRSIADGVMGRGQTRCHMTKLTAVRVASGLSAPVFVTAPTGDRRRLFIVEKTGRVRILDLESGQLGATPFLQLTGLSAGSEQGLLGLAFHPSYAENGHFYVNFTDATGATNIRRYSVSAASPDVADSVERPDRPHHPPAVREPQRRLDRLRAQGRLPLHRHGRRRERQRSGSARAEPERALGQAPAHRRQPERLPRRPEPELRDSAKQSLRRATGRASRDLGLWPAQSVAQQLRPRVRGPLHRGRGTGRPGGSERPARVQPGW